MSDLTGAHLGTYGVCMATNNTFEQRVGLNVETAIVLAGESTKGIADATGIARMTFARRRKDYSSLTVSELARIARHLGTTPEALIAEQVAAAA